MMLGRLNRLGIWATAFILLAGLAVRGWADPTEAKIPGGMQARDPLEDVGEVIRKQIDPKLGEQWPDYNPDFVEVIEEIHHEYDRFWERISPHTRWFVDLDNDGKNECVVLSQGLNDSAWGFRHFVAVLKPPTWPKEPSDPWELAYLYVFESAEAPALSFEEGRKAWWRDCEVQISDLDRDGRPDFLFRTEAIGGSAQSYFLHVISMHSDMSLRHHTLWSREPIEILEPDALRPVFVQHHEDEWLPEDFGADVRGRGHRKAYFHWTVNDGFVQF